MQYEDFIMREADRRIPAGAKVWDGAGWVLHHEPSYRYWFLRANVFVMEAHGYFEPYRIEDVLRDPPAEVVADYTVDNWLALHRPFAGFILTHYLPLWREIWLPGMSARVTPLQDFTVRAVKTPLYVLLGCFPPIYGPLAGAFGFKILEWLVSRQWPVYWPLFLGSIVVVVIVLLPSGFVGLVGGRVWRTTAKP